MRGNVYDRPIYGVSKFKYFILYRFFYMPDFALKSLIAGSLFEVCRIGLLVKVAINVIELKQGVLRIVDFDVEEKMVKQK